MGFILLRTQYENKVSWWGREWWHVDSVAPVVTRGHGDVCSCSMQLPEPCRCWWSVLPLRTMWMSVVHAVAEGSLSVLMLEARQIICGLC